MAVQPLEAGDKIGSGDMIAVIDTTAQGGVRKSELPESETWDCAPETLYPQVA